MIRVYRSERASRFAAVLAAVAVLVLFAIPDASAREYRNKKYGYFVDVPQSWQVHSADEQDRIAFTDAACRVVFQVLAFDAERFASASEIGSFVKERFGAEGDTAAFTFGGQDAVFADLRFSTGRVDSRGYFFFLNGGEGRLTGDFAVMSTAPEQYYQQYHDELLSALNSFAPGPRSRRAPGPVSQFYYAFPPPDRQDKTVSIPRAAGGTSAENGAKSEERGTADGFELSYRIDPQEAEISQIVIEREARILGQYAARSARWGGSKTGWQAAWKRYYRVIYRDNYKRLEPLARSLEQHFSQQQTPRSQIPRMLLKWLQGFRYVRVPTLSDLSSPVSALLERRGDCDSLGLIYTILLKHMDYDTILLVSRRYSHALAGGVTEGKGARYRFEGEDYLLAELTEAVPLGRIPADMADPSGWLAVPLP